VIEDENLLVELELSRAEAQMLHDVPPAGYPKQRLGYNISAYTLALEVLTGREARRKKNIRTGTTVRALRDVNRIGDDKNEKRLPFWRQASNVTWTLST
jgi:hypothetical protein